MADKNDKPNPAEPVVSGGTAEFTDMRFMLSHLLRRAHFFAEARFAKSMSRDGLTSRQLALMVAVDQNPGASQNAIGDIIALDRNSVSELVVRMVKKRLLKRETSQKDKRSFVLKLTDKGREIVADAALKNPGYQADLTANLSGAETRQLIEYLRRMVSL
ncbi:MarR family winged helix-turn-helix transcriptional regulator [Hoeflea poritis]|uniref:MarR family winged helix-turn-helix transcriptional regulator n=1 Tax=Hoeflea poritis TaxID=2993659 RepID=A0ABT4VLL6_9HYPH|nr:MarR family winged helix-turn-helix transcriptional regulator [Hoeflea poritis]MDA4845608.1 MarR family winged helix-turn-helix transcriptional regulator [Hoeflea poritis]